MNFQGIFAFSNLLIFASNENLAIVNLLFMIMSSVENLSSPSVANISQSGQLLYRPGHVKSAYTHTFPEVETEVFFFQSPDY